MGKGRPLENWSTVGGKEENPRLWGNKWLRILLPDVKGGGFLHKGRGDWVYPSEKKTNQQEGGGKEIEGVPGTSRNSQRGKQQPTRDPP